jgi:hypothetical protein
MSFPYAVKREDRIVAKFEDPGDAGAFVAVLGEGQITIADLVMWDEGKEKQPAAESYDYVADLVCRRLEAAANARRALGKAQTDGVGISKSFAEQAIADAIAAVQS